MQEEHKMHASKYNIYIKIPDTKKHLLVHGYTGAIDLMEDGLIEDVKKNNFCSMDDEVKTLLQNRGYVTNKSDVEEYERAAGLAKVFSKYESKQKHFTFLVSYNCNFRCPYCYEANISSSGKGWTKETFTKEQVDAAYSLIGSLSKPDEKHTIALYGGEPFLKENYEIVKYIVDKGRSQGYKFSAISNGYDLDFFKDFLGNAGVSMIQITIDGNEDAHNVRRRHFSDGDTFNKIIENISLALNKGSIVSLRINVDKKNINQLDSLADVFKTMGWIGNKNFSCYLASVQSRNESRLQSNEHNGDCLSDEILMEMMDVYKSLIQLQKRDQKYSVFKISQSYIKDSLKGALESQKSLRFKGNFCGATSTSLILDPRGDIYSCFEFVGCSDEVIGGFYPEFKMDTINNHRLTERKIYNIQNCHTCKYSLLCGGGCAAFSKNKYGNVMRSFCNQFPTLFHRNAIEAFLESKDKLNLKTI